MWALFCCSKSRAQCVKCSQYPEPTVCVCVSVCWLARCEGLWWTREISPISSPPSGAVSGMEVSCFSINGQSDHGSFIEKVIEPA